MGESFIYRLFYLSLMATIKLHRNTYAGVPSMYQKLLVLFLLLSHLQASQHVILFGDMGYPPYSYAENGEAKGVYVDIIKAAFDKMDDYDVEFIMVSWDRCKMMLKTGLAVGFFPPYFTQERTQWIDYSDKILEETTIVFASAEVLQDKHVFPDDFIGLTVCLNKGFAIEGLAGKKSAELIKQKKIHLVEGKNNNDGCLGRLTRKKPNGELLADFYINDRLIDISKYPSVKRGIQIKSNHGHVGFSKNTHQFPYVKEIKNSFNRAINTMKENGEIEAIVKQYTR